MKAILILNMPEVCTDCPMHKFRDIDNWDDPSGYCILGTETIDNVFQTKPSWCPLKPMPKFEINEKRVEFLNMTEREKHFYELGHDDASDEFYEEIEK